MRRNRSRLALLGILALALSVTAGLTIGDAAAAKKKKKPKAGGTVDITKAVNAPIPDGTATSNGALLSTIDVGGKKFKATKIRDVNVTVQTTGDTAAGSASQLTARLTAPNGATTWLINNSLSGQSVGPLTLDDESVNRLTTATPRDSTELGPPYQGAAQPDVTLPGAGGGANTLSVMDNGPVSGTWTLRFFDVSAVGPATSILNQWRLQVVAGRPFKTK